MKKILTFMFALIILSIPCTNAQDIENSISAKDYEKKFAADNLEYKKYKQMIKNDNYKLVVIIDKILRANNLQYQNWRFGINYAPKDINASSMAINLILINTSLYDSLYDNEDALAYILAHEISHLLLEHSQKRAEYNYNLNKLIRKREYLRRCNNLGGYMIVERKINKIHEKERLMEKEADLKALTLLIKAGYNPDNAMEALYFLSNGAEFYTTKSSHPETAARIKYMNEELATLDIESLKEEGRKNLYKNTVSTIRQSSDNKTVVLTRANNYSY